MVVRRLIHILFALSLAALLITVQPAQAQTVPSSQSTNSANIQPAGDPSSWLQPDGTLSVPPGMTGSFKLDGWKMALDEAGQPHFSLPQEQPAIANPDDAFWSHDFLLGAETIGFENDSYIFAMAVYNNLLYVGGDFTAVGSVPAQNIACWDGANLRWAALGSGVDSRVRTIAVYSNYVYAGGDFTTAGGISTGPLGYLLSNLELNREHRPGCSLTYRLRHQRGIQWGCVRRREFQPRRDAGGQ